ncbi:hypothetical protein [Vibrio rhodolitus]|uniref:hypothetical protein n=1 Tax=Vibrio rhodolitus TaxID=2231649 RepID=UPI0013DEC1EE|nr:hypothetical protein [Vibrio rhodolitus]
MKRFFPSSVMLTPFLVKPYPNQEEYACQAEDNASEATAVPVSQKSVDDGALYQEHSDN